MSPRNDTDPQRRHVRGASAGSTRAGTGEGKPSDDRRRFFQAEVERLMDRLYGTAVRLTRNGTEAEDLVADALTKAWSRLDTLEDLQAFEKWIFRILTNTFVSGRRRSRETPASALKTAEEDEEGDPVALFDRLHQPFLLWWGNPEQRLLDRILREDIARTLDDLPDPYRLAVILVDVEGFSYAEAAEELSVPVGTVRSRLSRGRALFQDALWHHARERGLTAPEAEG